MKRKFLRFVSGCLVLAVSTMSEQVGVMYGPISEPGHGFPLSSQSDSVEEPTNTKDKERA